MARLFASLARHATGRLLWVNLALLFAVKVAIPLGGSGLASITGLLTLPDSGQIVAETNKARTAAGVARLSRSAALDAAAQAKADDMAAQTYFGHVSPTGELAWSFIGNAGYRYSVAGENLGRGFSDPAELVGAWLASPPHRANIMYASYVDIGVAVKRIILDGKPATVVVQLFAAPSVAAATAPVPGRTTAPTASAVQIPQRVSTRTAIAPVPGPVPASDIVVASSGAAASRVGNLVTGYLSILLGSLTMAAGWVGWHRRLAFGWAAHAVIIAALMFVPQLSFGVSGAIF